MKKQIAPLFAALALLFSVVGCAATSSDTAMSSTAAASAAPAEAPTPAAAQGYDVAYDMAKAEEEPEMGGADYGAEMAVRNSIAGEGDNPGAAGEAVSPEPPAVQTRKIVYNVDLSLQTTAFDEGAKDIPAMIEETGGFVESSYIEGANMEAKYYSRSANFTARVPSESLNGFLARLGEAFHVVYEQKNSQDITSGYYDIQARLDSLRIQEERLKAMLEGATELKYMLEVERELADVLYEIERLTSSIRRMDSSVSLSTVTIHLQEVNTIDENQPVVQPITFGERISETFGDSLAGFVDFCQGFLLFLIALLPFLPLFAVIAAIVLLLVRSSRKRRAKRIVGQPFAAPFDSRREDTPASPQENNGQPEHTEE